MLDWPEGVIFPGSLSLANTPVRYLPANLTITHSLSLDLSDIVELPKGLKVGSDLLLRFTKLKTLPGDLSVGRKIDASDSLIETVPEGLKVPILVMARCPSLRVVPASLTTQQLNLDGSGISELPDNLVVNGPYGRRYGRVKIRHTRISRLPEGLITDTIYVDGTSIDTLPEGLNANTVVIGDAPVTKIPDGALMGSVTGKKSRKYRACFLRSTVHAEALSHAAPVNLRGALLKSFREFTKRMIKH